MERCKSCGQEIKVEEDGLPPMTPMFTDSEWYETDSVLFTHDKKRNVLLLDDQSGCPPYEVDLDRINEREPLMEWVLHLSEKDWMRSWDLRAFVEQVKKIKHGDHSE